MPPVTAINLALITLALTGLSPFPVIIIKKT
jgi:hypothetical protein